MVHSGSASPMTTTPSASPHLTAPAPAPPLQAPPPLVPPPPAATDQDLTQTPTKLLTPTITSSSGSTQPSTPTPPEVEPLTLTPATALSTNSGPASAQSPHTPAAAQGTVNGRSSGRKRTPKACDCCGPNSKGHNVKTSGRGGRGRGRDGPMRNCVAQERVGVQKKEGVMEGVIEGQGGAGVGKGGENRGGMAVRLCGTRGRGALVGRGRAGRGMMGATVASKMEVKVGVKRGGGVVTGSKTEARAGSVSTLRQEEEEGAEMEQGEDTDSGLATSPPGSGDRVTPSGTGTGGEGREDGFRADNVNVIEPGNGLSVSGWLPGLVSRSETPQDPDSEMQVDQAPDRTVPVSIPVTLSNGNAAAPTDQNHGSSPMEMQTLFSPPSQDCILVCTMQHRWALRDHRLYCQPGTWEKEQEEEQVAAGKGLSEHTDGRATDGQTQEKDSLELLTEMVHEFLENFYVKYGSFIALSETDVLEYLKKKGNSDLSNRLLDIPGEVSRYRAGLASAPVAGFMVTYNKHTLSLEDLSTLEEQNWLNDQIINMYGELIMEATQHKVHFFNSFFHKQLVAKGYEGVKRWNKKVDLFSKWLLLVPIHLEIHWSLITVDIATKTISYYDSQGIVFKHTIDNIMKYLQSEAREKKQTAYQKGWRMVIIKGIPQQKNDSDCGVFVLEYCRRLSVKQPLQFTQEDMPRIRKRIYKELCDCRLND
ncbi:sentrin-specific protease 5 [Centroberyx gerrardi]|uniref:sentrin-specific protease 5 n=1 Tax=Centroberyx gerrardi TaxID=166262 RepID=UPI003AAEDC4B